ncbi:MAG: TMEM175 family protein [Microthrixaceae bacterium]
MATVEGIETGRSFDRLVNFTDAVVAIAITVLVLPLTEIVRPADGQTVWGLIAAHSGEVSAFFFTFLVVALLWGVHNRVVNRLRGYDVTLFWLNITWVAAIAFLPWPAALYGSATGIAAHDRIEWVAGEGLGGIGLLYWATLALISVVGALMGHHARRRPVLLEPEDAVVGVTSDGLGQYRGYLFGAYFLAIGVVSLFSPVVASWMPVGLIVLALLVPSVGSRHARGGPAERPES